MTGLIFFWMIGVIVVGIIWFLWATTATWTTLPRRLARTLIVLLVLFFSSLIAD
jgi:predicted small integral membrane protein